MQKQNQKRRNGSEVYSSQKIAFNFPSYKEFADKCETIADKIGELQDYADSEHFDLLNSARETMLKITESLKK